LVYDVYYPDYNNYITCPLPFIVFAHGGGFAECAGIEADGLDVIAKEFAKRGFVCFLVNYRSGVSLDPLPLTNTSVQQMEAIYKAGQDMRGAIRSIIKRQLNETTGDNWQDTFRIDLENMFLGGNSAGSVAMLNAAYYPTQAKINAVFPVTTGSVSFQDALGSINHDAYYGENTISYYSKIRGVLNMWGSMFLPYANRNNPSGFFSGNTNNAPIISFHGVQDKVFNYKSQEIRFSLPPTLGNYNHNSDVNCLYNTPLILNGVTNIDQYSLGAQYIFEKILQPLQIFRELYLDCSMDHGLDKGTVDDLDPNTKYCSDFGIGTSTTSSAVLSYIIQRACTFFQAIIGSTSGTLEGDPNIHKVFIECVNNRNKCTALNLSNNDCGSNPAIPCSNQAQSDNLNCHSGDIITP